jgi:hypothetical protein
VRRGVSRLEVRFGGGRSIDLALDGLIRVRAHVGSRHRDGAGDISLMAERLEPARDGGGPLLVVVHVTDPVRSVVPAAGVGDGADRSSVADLLPDPTTEGTHHRQHHRNDEARGPHQRCDRHSQDDRDASGDHVPPGLTREDRDEDQEPATKRERDREPHPHARAEHPVGRVVDSSFLGAIPRPAAATPHPAAEYRAGRLGEGRRDPPHPRER